MRRVLFMALFCLSLARSLRSSPGGRSLAFLGASPVSLRHASSHPPTLKLRASKKQTGDSASATAAAASKSTESSIDMKARLGVGKAKNVGQKGPSLYTLGEGAKSGLPPGCGAGLAPPLFTVLGIETSCDDTGAAVVRSDGCVLGEALASQHTIHAKFGGVVPGLAKDAHEQNIDAVIGTALAQAGLKPSEIDAVAVTVGPGLEICLRVGATAARALAASLSKPFVEVHHLEAHCLLARPHLFYPATSPQSSAASELPHSVVVDTEASSDATATAVGDGAKSTATEQQLANLQVDFPFCALLVSGGHCQTLLVHGVGDYAVLGGTLDDALGEAYDKAARMLGISVSPGGPALEELAKTGNPKSVYAKTLPVPLQRKPGCDFSYAGLKNAFRMQVQKAVADHEEAQQRQELEAASKSTTDAGAAAQETPLHEATSSSGSVYVTSRKQVDAETSGAKLPLQVRADLASAFQQVAVKHLTQRLTRALDTIDAHVATKNKNAATDEPVPAIQTLAVVGGVAANQAVRTALSELCASRSPPLNLVAPPPRLCTDNGVMVAWAGVEKLLLGISDPVELPPEPEPRAPPAVRGATAGGGVGSRAEKRKGRARDVRPRWPLGAELETSS